MEQLVAIGIIVIVIGIMLIIIGSISMIKSKGKTEWAIGGFIGPIPFGWASREDLLKFIIFVSIVFLFVFIILNLTGR